MQVKFSDRCAVSFAKLTGGNISKKTASSLVRSIENAGNSPEKISKAKISEDVWSALKNKDVKHKELSIALRLNVFNAKRDVANKNSEINTLKENLNEQKKIIANCEEVKSLFSNTFNKLGHSQMLNIAMSCEPNTFDAMYSIATNNRMLLSPNQTSLLNRLERTMGNAQLASQTIEVIDQDIKQLESKKDLALKSVHQLEHSSALKK